MTLFNPSSLKQPIRICRGAYLVQLHEIRKGRLPAEIKQTNSVALSLLVNYTD
jgi:hypothetical protein